MTTKYSQFTAGGLARTTDITVGLRGGINVQFTNTGLADSLGSTLVTYTQVIAPGSAVNYIDISNEISGAAPAVTAKGSDVNVNLRLQGQGVTGYVEIVSTGAMILPIGTTGEQPAGAAGEFRYNSTTGLIEWYDGVAGAWKSASAASGTVTSVSGSINQIDSTGGITPTLSLSSTLIFPGTATLTNSNALQFIDGAAGFASFAPPAGNFVGNATYSLPNNVPGTNGFVLSCTTAGVMSWIAAATGSVTSVTTTLPLVSSGGTTPTIAMQGLTGLSQGDLIYGDTAANTFARLAKDANATRYLSNQGATNGPSWNQVNLANGVTGVLTETNGGTHQSTYTLGDILYASAANTLSKLAGNTTITQKFLAQTGDGVNSAAPTWQAVTIPSASAVTVDITQANAFVGGEWVYLNGTTYTVASNASVVTAEGVGVVQVTPAPTGTTFSLQTAGRISGLAGLTAGAVYFLNTAGALTTVIPTAVGTVVKPLMVADTTTSGLITNFRGELNEAPSFPNDVAFVAGFNSAGVKVDVAVQPYGQIVMARTGSFTGEAGYADTAPTGTAAIVDVLKNGVTIYTTKPQFAATAQTLTAGVLKTDGTQNYVSGDRITFSVTQVGGTLTGQGFRFTATGVV